MCNLYNVHVCRVSELVFEMRSDSDPVFKISSYPDPGFKTWSDPGL